MTCMQIFNLRHNYYMQKVPKTSIFFYTNKQSPTCYRALQIALWEKNFILTYMYLGLHSQSPRYKALRMASILILLQDR